MTDEIELPQSVADEGTDSFLRGLPREDCPYPPGADERKAWLSGWDLARARGKYPDSL
jgi:ribosome modulation factor